MLYIKNHLLPLTLSLSLAITACGEKSSSREGADYNPADDTTSGFDQLALISHLTDNVISPTFTVFQSQAQVQQNLVAAYCEAENNTANSTESIELAKQAAQQQWRSTMATWQQAELMLLGPLVDNDGSLRNKIYSWPVVNSCSVDFDVMYFKSGVINGKPYDIATRTPTRKGLAALDYLLFNDSLAHSCELSSPPPGWDNLTAQEQKIARCNFAAEISLDIRNNADTLISLWTGENGYANKLKQAGTTGSAFSSEHEAVNRISNAMFYLDSATKDGKLATPLGLFDNSCGNTPCPKAVESPYSQNSFNNVYNNLIGFEKLLTGDGVLGFTDYLIDVGDQATADTMLADTNRALNELSDVAITLTQALSTDPAPATQTHTNVKSISDKLKTDFINSLALELPATSAGDND